MLPFQAPLESVDIHDGYKAVRAILYLYNQKEHHKLLAM